MKKSVHKKIKYLVLIIVFSVSKQAIADIFDIDNSFFIFKPSTNTPAKLSGDIAIGGSVNTGNSNSYNLNTKLDLGYAKNKWINTGIFQSQIGGDRNTGLNNRNYNLQAQSKYFFSPPVSYWYGLTNYTLDSFNTYRTVSLSSIGYGRRLLNQTTMTLDLEAGPSYTRRRIQGNNGAVETEFGVLTSADYTWLISHDIKFNQTLTATKDDLNTYTEATTSLTSKIIKNLAISLSFNYKHNTTIPPESSDTDKTDTQTVVSVVYGFSS